MTDTVTALVELVQAMHRGADPEQILHLTERAIALLERDTERVFWPDDELEAVA